MRKLRRRSWKRASRSNQGNLYALCDEANDHDLAMRLTEVAKSYVNKAASLITRLRYDEAMAAATKAREIDRHLPTAHIAILAIHIRLEDQDGLLGYLNYLFKEEPWFFEDEVFLERVKNDPDLVGLAEIISTHRKVTQ